MQRPGIERFHDLVRGEHRVPVRDRGGGLRRIWGEHPNVITHLAGRQHAAGRLDVATDPVQIPRVRARRDALGIGHTRIVGRAGAVAFEVEHKRIVETQELCARRQVDESQEAQPVAQLVHNNADEVDLVAWRARVETVVPDVWERAGSPDGAVKGGADVIVVRVEVTAMQGIGQGVGIPCVGAGSPSKVANNIQEGQRRREALRWRYTAMDRTWHRPGSARHSR